MSSVRVALKVWQEFNARLRCYVEKPVCLIVSMDMVDCFHHWPIHDQFAPNDLVSSWAGLSEHLRACGFSSVLVPTQTGQGPGRVGRYDCPAWVVIRFGDICVITETRRETTVLQVGRVLGMDVHGAPLGDVLSSAPPRLLKWQRERAQRHRKAKDEATVLRSNVRFVHMHDCFVVVLDMSSRLGLTHVLRMECVLALE